MGEAILAVSGVKKWCEENNCKVSRGEALRDRETTLIQKKSETNVDVDQLRATHLYLHLKSP